MRAFAAAVLVMVSALSSAPALALDDDRVAGRLKQRFDGDRSGACVLAAMVDGERVARGRFCARSATAPSDNAAFEIGSLAKTMTAFLVADLIEHHGWALDDPIARHLPEGTRVPAFDGQQIRVRHLVTHTSGLPPLPPGMAPKDPADPYADVTAAMLLQALGSVRLQRAPGAQPAYSNFGMMVLSLAVARAYGTDIETALRTRLLEPLDMRDASVGPRSGVTWVQGHAPGGEVTPPWTIAPELAGVGIVRASLDVLVKYLQAQMGLTPTPLAARIERTQQPVAAGFGINWALATVRGRSLVLHEGGTAGFSSVLVFDKAARKGVVMLADTALADLGGLGDAALPLLLDLPMAAPRRALPTPEALLATMPGDYEITAVNLRLRLWAEDGRLNAQAAGQAAYALGYDSRGDFYPTGAPFPYLLRPQPEEGGRVDRLLLRQGGGAVEAVWVNGGKKTWGPPSPLNPPAPPPVRANAVRHALPAYAALSRFSTIVLKNASFRSARLIPRMRVPASRGPQQARSEAFRGKPMRDTRHSPVPPDSIRRRVCAALSALTPVAALAGAPASVQAQTRGELRIGYQKSASLFVLQKAQGSLEKKLAPLGFGVKWVEFPAGPQLLEGLNVGAVDVGHVGEAPPIFAQAAGARFVYVGHDPAAPRAEAIVVPKGSPIRTVAELKGRKIALNKGSNVHYLLVRQLEKHGLKLSDVQPAYLTPADGRAAFENGSVDAWAIWDPFLAAAEKSIGAQVLADGSGGVVNNYLFYLAERGFAGKHQKVLDALFEDSAERGAWLKANLRQAAEQIAPLQGLPVDVVELSLRRYEFNVKPISSAVAAHQQQIADTFYELKLIPKPLRISDAIISL